MSKKIKVLFAGEAIYMLTTIFKGWNCFKWVNSGSMEATLLML